MFTINVINQISIGNELRSQENDTYVKCKVVGGLMAFTFKIYILYDLDNKSNSSTVLMAKEITQETSLSR